MQPIEEVYKIDSSTVYKYLIGLTQGEDISEGLTQGTFAIALNRLPRNCFLVRAIAKGTFGISSNGAGGLFGKPASTLC